eukprot:5921321-Pleurochrysis_carterae.AAC.3
MAGVSQGTKRKGGEEGGREGEGEERGRGKGGAAGSLTTLSGARGHASACGLLRQQRSTRHTSIVYMHIGSFGQHI